MNCQAQAVYKWTDANGVVHFGDSPPSDASTEQVAIARAPTPPPGPTAEAPAKEASAPRIAVRKQALNIVMYATTRCGYCARARRYFAANDIPYSELDIDNSKPAHIAWKRLGGQGVPLFVINDKVSSGFSAESMSRRLAPLGW